MRRTLLATAGISVLVLILLVVNGLCKAVFRTSYLDLTEEKLYTLSSGTKKILQSIDTPITLNYYFSRTEAARVPGILIFGRRVGDLLREYERFGRGKIVLNVYDPRPDTEEEEWAQKFGLTPIPLRTGEKVFFGLAGRASDGTELSIPVFDTALNPTQQQFLEYQISKLIASLVAPEKPVVGILSPLKFEVLEEKPILAGMLRKWFFLEGLEENAEVRFIDRKAAEIDSRVDVLAVIHPKSLPLATVYAIDQFVMRGGKLIILEDPFCESDVPRPSSEESEVVSHERSSNLNRLTERWGVELQGKRVVADTTLATPVGIGQAGVVKNFPVWLHLKTPNVAENDIVTSGLESLVFPWAGALKLSPVEGVTHTVLLKTTTASMLLQENADLFVRDPDDLLRGYIRGGVELPLAVRVRGKLRSAFDAKPTIPREDIEKGDPKPLDTHEHLSETKEEANVIIVSDVDFLADRYSVEITRVMGTRLASRFNDNLVFFENAVEHLRGSSDLIGIRSRGQFSREFVVVKKLEEQARERFQLEESVLQARLEGANMRLNELQRNSRADGSGGQNAAFGKAVMEEVRKIREERLQAQRRLREVRRNLREEIERLGNRLFLLNTFAVPVLLMLSSFVYSLFRMRRGSAGG